MPGWKAIVITKERFTKNFSSTPRHSKTSSRSSYESCELYWRRAKNPGFFCLSNLSIVGPCQKERHDRENGQLPTLVGRTVCFDLLQWDLFPHVSFPRTTQCHDQHSCHWMFYYCLPHMRLRTAVIASPKLSFLGKHHLHSHCCHNSHFTLSTVVPENCSVVNLKRTLGQRLESDCIGKLCAVSTMTGKKSCSVVCCQIFQTWQANVTEPLWFDTLHSQFGPSNRDHHLKHWVSAILGSKEIKSHT